MFVQEFASRATQRLLRVLRLTIAAKIWLSIGIFVLGFLFCMGMTHLQGRNTEERLRTVSEALFPAALWGQEASEAFGRMVKDYADAVVMEDPAGLEHGAQEGSRVLECLRAEASISGLGEDRARILKQLAASVEQFLTDAGSTYSLGLNPDTMRQPAVPEAMAEMAARTKALEFELKQAERRIATALRQELQTLQTRSARLRWVLLLVFGTTLSLAAILVNFTIRRSITGPLLRSQAELARERDLLGTLIDTIPDFIAFKDAEGRFLRVNRAQSLLLGISDPEEAVGRTESDFFDLETEQRSEEREIVRTGNPLIGRFEQLSRPGVSLSTWVSTAKVPVKDASGQVQGVVSVSRDISDWKEATDALRRSEQSFRELFAVIPHSVWVYDSETLQFLEVNATALRHYGYSTAEFRNLPLTEVHAPEERPRLRRSLTLLDPGKPPGGEWKHITRDGRVLDVEVTGHVFDFQGRKAVLSVVQDVTERKRLEFELHQAQRLETVGQLAAGIAHEINTPIQYVGDNIRFLQEAFNDYQAVFREMDPWLQPGGAEEADRVPGAVRNAMDNVDFEYVSTEIPKAISQSLDGVERVATIVRAMKEFAHPGEKQKTAADINQALANALIVGRNEFKYVADVETDYGELPPVVCDIAEMNQVFLNLLINAAHAIGDVMRRTSQRGKITVRTRQVNERAVIAISDTGCGIPEAIRSKIFDPFFTTKPVGRGSGQGLTIARSIVVDKHGGALTFEANGSQGTTFVISVPLEPAGAAAAAD
ncbi:MAG: hypothetical protein C5B51_16190 [Terriglobia bacterium]|nr:MAG: hypothetical protein C5B51_16190 [Terriglobia bacterium]